MPTYNYNLLPDSYDDAWEYSNITRLDSNTVLRFNAVDSYARYAYSTTGFSATGYMLVNCASASGSVYLCIAYLDSRNNVYDSHAIALTTGMSLPIVLHEAEAEGDLLFTLYTAEANSQVGLVEVLFMEQAISSVDIEFASGTSRVIPPEDGWSTSAPQWQTGHYIWQRTATTFVDGHTEYSDPICLQNTESAGVYSIVEQYYLSTSDTAQVGGSWVTEQPIWVSGKYIWTRTEIQWTDQTTTYTDPVLARAINQANEEAQQAQDDVVDLDQSLNQQTIFDRLTNNGEAEGLFLDNGDVYVNASYINAGVLAVSGGNNFIFRASLEDESVQIGGFLATYDSIYYGACQFLDSNGLGVYIGVSGITSGNNSRHITIADGHIRGGWQDANAQGWIIFGPYLQGWDSTGGIYITGYGGVLIGAPGIGVHDQAGSDSSGTYSVGCTGQISVPDWNYFVDHPYVYRVTKLSNGNLSVGTLIPAAYSMIFHHGINVHSTDHIYDG